MQISYSRNDKLISRKFYQYLIPTVLMVLAMQFGSLADAIVIGNFIGDAALTASSLALPAIFLVEIPGVMIAVGTSIVAANFIGKRQVAEASKVFKLALLLSFLVSLIFIPIGLFAGDAVAGLFSGNFPELAPMIAQYMKGYCFQAPVLAIGFTIAYFVSSDNNPNLSAAYFIICNVAHIGAEILFCAFLDKSVAMWGAAFSMGIGMAAGCIVIIPYIRSKRRVVDLTASLKGAFRFTPAILKAGSSTGAMTGLSFVYYLVLNIAATSYLSAPEMPVFAMLSNFAFVVDLFVIGVLQIMPSVISSLYGEKDYFSVRSVAKRVFVIAMAVTAALTAVSLAFPEMFFVIFGVDLAETRAAMAPGMPDPLFVVRIYCISFFLYSLNKYLVYYYPSILINSPALVCNVVRIGLVGPVVIFFLMRSMGALGNAIGVIIMEASTLAITVGFILLGKKLKRLPGTGLLLLPKEGQDQEVFDVSIPAQESEISQAIEELQKRAFELCGNETSAAMLALASEEIIANTIAYGYKRKAKTNYIDVRVCKTDTGMMVRIRDDGVSFDPTTYQSEEEEMRFAGIEVIRKVASDFKYLRVLNTNNTIMEITIA